MTEVLAKAAEARAARGIVGCMGKLPAYPEMIRYNVRNDSLKLLEQWLQESVAHVYRDHLILRKPHQQLGLNHALLLYYAIGRKPIIARVADSQDSDGRNFPFLAFQELSDDNIVELQPYIPLLYQPSFETFAQLPIVAARAANLKQFFSELTTTAPQVEDDAVAWANGQLDKVTFDAWWSSIMPQAPFEQSACLLAALRQVTTRINSNGCWQVHLPIAAGEMLHLSVSFWLTLLRALNALHYRNMHLAWTLVPQSNTMRLTIYHGTLNVAFFRSLISTDTVRLRQINVLKEMQSVPAIALEAFQFAPDTSLLTLLNTVRETFAIAEAESLSNSTSI